MHASASHRGLLGEDQVDWTGVLGALHKVGYKGDVVIESFSKTIKSLPKRHRFGARYIAAPSNWQSKDCNFLKKLGNKLSNLRDKLFDLYALS